MSASSAGRSSSEISSKRANDARSWSSGSFGKTGRMGCEMLSGARAALSVVCSPT